MSETQERAAAPEGPRRTADEITGELVHQEMWRRRLSQREVGACIGVDQSTLSKKLRGDRGWTLDEVLAIARFLEVGVADLLPAADYVPSPSGRGRVGVHVDERPAAPGGGRAFLPLEEGSCAPSRTRTANPLIPALRGRLVVVPFKRPAALTPTRQGRLDTRRPIVRTRHHLRLVDEAAS